MTRQVLTQVCWKRFGTTHYVTRRMDVEDEDVSDRVAILQSVDKLSTWVQSMHNGVEIVASKASVLTGDPRTEMAPRLDDLYGAIAHWQGETFPGVTANGVAEHLRREVVDEIWFEHWSEHWSIDHPAPGSRPLVDRTPRMPSKDMSEEAADVFFLLVQYCEVMGIDLPTAVARKLEINKARKWKAPDAHGVVEHEEEA